MVTAASIFSRCFFEAVSRGDDYPRAFEQAKHGVSVVTRAGQDSSGLPCQVPKYEFKDPDAPRAPPAVALPSPVLAPAAVAPSATAGTTGLAPAPVGARALSSAASPQSSSKKLKPIPAGVPLLLHRPGKYV